MSTGSGAKMRITVLVIILLAVVGMFAYDWFVMVPKGNKILEDLGNLALKSMDETNRADIHKLVGREPVKSTPVPDTKLSIEEFRMPRLLPFAPTTSVWVVYQDEQYTRYSTTEITVDNVRPKVVKQDFDPDNIPLVAGGAGGGGGGGGRRGQQNSNQADNAEQQGNNEGGTGQANEGGEQKAGGQEGEEKKDDGQTGENQGEQTTEKKDDGTGEEKKEGDGGQGEGGGEGGGSGGGLAA